MRYDILIIRELHYNAHRLRAPTHTHTYTRAVYILVVHVVVRECLLKLSRDFGTARDTLARDLL